MPQHAWQMTTHCCGCKGALPRGTRNYLRYGPFVAHDECDVHCAACGEQIHRLPIGSQHTVVPHCGEPVHAACKKAMQP